jgi:hypothetical protein
MASTINASTSAGLVSTADTSGVLQLQTAGTTAVTVDAIQNVGIGTTPAVMFSSARALQLGAGTILEGRSASATVSTLSSNQYINASSARTYITSDFASYYSQINGQHQFYTAPSGTAGTTATFTQVLALNKDQTVALQGASLSNGIGIAFPATQSASTDANTLDDYEEGTWTPTIGGTATYTVQSGRYTKIGRMVYVAARLDILVIGTGSTTTISGLPFTAVATNVEAGVCINRANSIATAVVSLYMLPILNDIQIQSRTAASVSQAVNAIFANTANLEFGGWYQTT